MNTRAHCLLRKLSAALAVAALAALHAFIDAPPAASARGAAGPKERSIRKVDWPGEPFKIEEIKVGGRAVAPGAKFSAEDDWLRGLTVKVRNVSDKPVLFLDVALNFPRQGSPEPESRDHLLYGLYPTPPGEAAPEPPAVGQPPILPGETAELVLTDYEGTRRFLDQTNYPGSITELEIEISDAFFDRDTKWSGGQIFRRDPRDPNRWAAERGPAR